MLLFYCGCAWAADAVEMMLLSFLGPAVSSSPGCVLNRPAQLQYYWEISWDTAVFLPEENSMLCILTGSSTSRHQVQAV